MSGSGEVRELPRDIDYPIDCDTFDKKLEYLGELDEVLRLWHNLQVKGKDWMGAKTFFDSKFIGKSQEIHRQINEIIDQEGLWLWDDELGGWVKNKPKLTNTWKPPLSKLDYVEDREVDIFDPFQNFNVGYITSDPSNFFTISGSGFKIDFTALEGKLGTPFARIGKDFGVDFFDGDFEHLHELKIDSSTSDLTVMESWQLSNIDGNLDDILGANGDCLMISIRRDVSTSLRRIALVEVDGGALYADVYDDFLTNLLYKKTSRVEAVAPNGTVYHYIFDDAPRSNLLDTLTIALHTSKKNYRRFYPITQRTGNAAQTITGFVQNYDLQLPITTRPYYYNNLTRSGLERRN